MIVMRSIKRESSSLRQKKAKANKPSISLKEAYAQMDEWPREWRGDDDDIPYGEKLMAEMKPFITHFITEHSPARKTVLNHLAGLFLLGGEIIRRINLYDEDRKIPPGKLLDDSIDEEGGPLCRHAEEGEALRSYDAACRKLYKFRSTSRQAAHKFR